MLYVRQLVDEARKQERLLWYTPKHPDTPLHTSLPLNTAVALPISLSVLRRDLCFVFFAENDIKVGLARHQNQDIPLFVVHRLRKHVTRCRRLLYASRSCGATLRHLPLRLSWAPEQRLPPRLSLFVVAKLWGLRHHVCIVRARDFAALPPRNTLSIR